MTTALFGKTGQDVHLKYKVDLSTIVRQITDQHIAPRVIKQYLDSRMTIRLESLGLQGSQGPYLLAIARDPGASMKEIAAHLMVDKSITTRTVGTLIDMGLVRNESGNTRRYSLMLTEEGKNAVEKIEETFSEIWGSLLCDLTEEEQRVFESACAKIKARLNEGAGN